MSDQAPTPSPNQPADTPAPVSTPANISELADLVRDGTYDLNKGGTMARALGGSSTELAKILSIMNQTSTPTDIAEPTGEDLENALHEQMNEAYFAVKPAQEHEYTLPPWSRPGEPEPSIPAAERAQHAANFRGWMADAGLDVYGGSSFAAQVDSLARQHKDLSASEAEEYGLRERAKLDQRYGQDILAKFEKTNRMFLELEQKRPGIIKLFKEGGPAFDNAVIWSQLFSLADRYFARKAGKPLA